MLWVLSMCTRTTALRIHHWATVSPSHCASMVVQHAWRQRLVVHTAHVHLATRPFRRAIRFACTSAVGQARWKICWRYALCFGAHASAWLTPCVPWQGYLISLSMDHGHDTMIDVTSATSLAQVHTLIQEALNTQHNVVGLSFCELGKEVRTACLVDLIPLSSNSDARVCPLVQYVCPLSLVLLYPSLFSQRRNPGRTFMPVLEYVGPGADAQPRQHPGVAAPSHGDVQAQTADSQSDGGDSDDSSSGEPASAAVALKEGHGRCVATAVLCLYYECTPWPWLVTCCPRTPPALVPALDRPLTAPPSDKTQGMARFRPTRREGHGRPLSAIPSDKTHGGRRLRPNRQEGRGRPCSATPSTLRSPGSKSRRSSPDGSGLDTPASAGTGATGGESSPAVPTPTFRRQFAWGAAAVAPGAGAGAGDGDGDGARRGGAGLSTGIHRGEEFDGRAPLAALPAFRGSPEHAQAGATGLDAVDLASDAGALKPDVPLHMHEELLSRARPTSAPAGGRRTRSGVTRTGPGWRQRFGVQQDAWMVVSPGGESTSSVDDPSECVGCVCGCVCVWCDWLLGTAPSHIACLLQAWFPAVALPAAHCHRGVPDPRFLPPFPRLHPGPRLVAEWRCVARAGSGPRGEGAGWHRRGQRGQRVTREPRVQ